MSTATVFNIIGIVGACLLLFGFYRINSGRWTNKSLWYEVDNVLGATLIIVYQVHYHTYITIVVNAIWGAVALAGVLAFFHRLRQHRARRAKTRP